VSYEHCEKHDCEATNGCEKCTLEVQSACKHEHAVCSICNAVVHGFDPKARVSEFEIFLTQEETDFALSTYQRAVELFGPARAAGFFLGTGLLAIEEGGGTPDTARNILNNLLSGLEPGAPAVGWGG
jgi:hypothetical protein